MQTYTASDKQKLYVKVIGRAPLSSFFMHGPPATGTGCAVRPVWRMSIAAFCWDARGHGGHALTVQTEPSVGRMAEDLKDLLGHFQLKSPVIGTFDGEP